MTLFLDSISHLNGTLEVPGDKSISHRALIFGALALKNTEIDHISDGADVRSTMNCLKNLGVEIHQKANRTHVKGCGSRGFSQPNSNLDCGNSGTTLRLFMGILPSQNWNSTLTGDTSLSRRPMSRISNPLRQMGAEFDLFQGDFPPVQILGKRKLKGIDYTLPIASAQVKSSILLAGLLAEGNTLLRGKLGSRDHTERLLPHFGAKLYVSPKEISLQGEQELFGTQVNIPGDLSSAAYWIAAATLLPKSHIELKNVSLNPTRTGILNVIQRMGGRIQIEITEHHPEVIGIIDVRSASLCGTVIEKDEIPFLIDELPLIAVLATFAEGTTWVKGAEELRVKETDRIEAIATNLRSMGAEIETFPDGFKICGPQKLKGARVHSFGDHRIAMAFSVAACATKGTTQIQESECIDISYPGFFDALLKLKACALSKRSL